MSDVIISIIGAGVIGTSLGLALKLNDDIPQLVVHDKEAKNVRKAMEMKAFDKSEWNLINATEPADLIVLAIPSAEIKPTLEAIAPYLKQDAIISDTNQTKGEIMTMAQGILPDHVHFVGGNPIVSADPGPENARSNLFEKRLYCLTPSPKVLPDAVQLLEDFVALIGATTFYLDPQEHDGLMSGISTLPTLLGVALLNGVSDQPSWVEMRKLASGLFSQVTSGVVGDPDSIAADILHKPENTLRWLDIALESLTDLRTTIEANDPEVLAQTLDKAFVTRHNWQKDFANKQLSNLTEPMVDGRIDEPGVFQRMLGFGGMFSSRRAREQQNKDKK
ncbi:MAG: prephenate dehydrogenase [Chloroflexota bacterium]